MTAAQWLGFALQVSIMLTVLELGLTVTQPRSRWRSRPPERSVSRSPTLSSFFFISSSRQSFHFPIKSGAGRQSTPRRTSKPAIPIEARPTWI